MKNKNIVAGIFIIIISFFVFLSCHKKDEPIIETCFDNIKNQNEIQTDCGGYCLPCAEAMTAKINGASWSADTSKIKASYSANSSTFQLNGSVINPFSQISLVYLGPLSLGQHTLNNSSSFTPNLTGFVVFNSGTITLDEIDSRNNLISGTFNFTSADTSTSTNYVVTEGKFTNVAYVLN
jgi:hypothetical protein